MKEVEFIYIKHIMKAADELNIIDKINTLDKQLSSEFVSQTIRMVKTIIKDIKYFWKSFSWVASYKHQHQHNITWDEANISKESWRQQIDGIRNTIYAYERVLAQSVYKQHLEWIDYLLNEWYHRALDLNAPTTWEVGYVYEVEAKSAKRAKEITNHWFHNNAKPLRTFANKLTGE